MSRWLSSGAIYIGKASVYDRSKAIDDFNDKQQRQQTSDNINDKRRAPITNNDDKNNDDGDNNDDDDDDGDKSSAHVRTVSATLGAWMDHAPGPSSTPPPRQSATGRGYHLRSQIKDRV